jgi:hypothetical protein
MGDLESRIEVLVSLGIVDSDIEIPIVDKEIEPEAVRSRQLLLDGARVVIAPPTQRLKILIGTVDE